MKRGIGHYFKHRFYYFIVFLLIPVFFTIPTAQAVDPECAVTSAFFKPQTVSSSSVQDGILTFNYSQNIGKSIGVEVQTEHCLNTPISVSVVEFGGTDLDKPAGELEKQDYLVPASGKLEFVLDPTEYGCGYLDKEYDCNYKIVVFNESFFEKKKIYTSSDFVKNGITIGHQLAYDCNGTCADDGNWKLLSTTGIKASSSCVIKKGEWLTNLGSTPINLRTSQDPGLEMQLTTTGCVGWTGFIQLKEIDSGLLNPNNDASEDFLKFFFEKNGSGITRIPLIAGEVQCDPKTPNCTIQAIISGEKGPNKQSGFTLKNTLSYNCKIVDDCSAKDIWQVGGDLGDSTKKTVVVPIVSPAGCSVVSANLDPYTKKTELANDSFFGGYSHGWFWQEKRDVVNLVTLSIKTKNCAGGNIAVDVVGKEIGSGVYSTELPVGILHGRSFTVPPEETFTITVVAGEEMCRTLTAKINEADCKFNIQTTVLGTDGKETIYDSIDAPFGNLNFECDALANPTSVGNMQETLQQNHIPVIH